MSAFQQAERSAAMPQERALKNGHVYRAGPAGALRCTTHGQPLIEKDDVMVCRGCDMRVLREQTRRGGFAAPVKVAQAAPTGKQAGSQRRDA